MKSTAIILLFTFFTISAQAQIVNQIGNSVKKSTETNATDFNRSRSNKEHNLNNSSPVPAGGSNETVSDSLGSEEQMNAEPSLKVEYIFDSKITYKFETFENNEVLETKYMNYNFNDSVFMFHAETGLMINDYKLNKMLMLDEDSKAGMSTNLVSPEILKMTLSTGLVQMNYIKTGKTKEIAGYVCSEYRYKDPQEKQVSVWVSKENPYKDLPELVKTNVELFLMNFGVISPEQGSFSMGIDQLNENGQIESSMVFDTLSKEESRVNLSDYQITSY